MTRLSLTYTPGPWHVAQGHDERDFIVAEASGNTVCEPNIHCFDFGELDPSVRTIRLEKAKANARLIAASPDMLDALKQIDKWARGSSGENRYYSFEFDSPIGEALREAIAKATLVVLAVLLIAATVSAQEVTSTPEARRPFIELSPATVALGIAYGVDIAGSHYDLSKGGRETNWVLSQHAGHNDGLLAGMAVFEMWLISREAYHKHPVVKNVVAFGVASLHATLGAMAIREGRRR